MSRHAFWTIIVGGSPTAFRAPLPEDLQPTLVQLQRAHPDAVIRWFEKGQLWETPGHAQDAFAAKQDATRPRRGPTWRPGGDHKDPRDKYKLPRDVKRKKWASQAAEGRGPWVKDARKGGTKEGRRNEGGRNEGGTAGPAPRDDRAPTARTAPPVPGRTPTSRDDRRPASGSRPPAAGRKPPFRREGDAVGQRPTGGQRPAGRGFRPAPGGDRRSAGGTRPPGGDRRPAGAERRPASGDRRPATGDRRPPGASSRPPSSGRPPRPPGTPSAPPPPASGTRKPRVFKAGEIPPKRKKGEDE